MKFTLIALSAAALAHARTLTVLNACSYTVWPAVFTDLDAGSAFPDYPTGWEADPNTSVTFTIPDNWTAGSVWGRRNCDFTGTGSASQCLDGGCDGGLECDPHTGTPTGPVTVAEFSLSNSGSADIVDVSIVDGFNIPLRVDNNKGCFVPGCPVDLNPNCPAALKGPLDSSGSTVGCQSACEANVDGNPINSPNCCTGSHETPATCPASGVAYYSYFKNNCPDALAFAYDEDGQTLICSSSLAADYTVTFCP
ncbi:hypothetical protein PHLGIDRAFT_507322 [Phlebiopsis gigantea 11061_1 CR5-6]|uniref:Thaumatin-like protein n=1 Tax=Phlebiopsis gigantea (strain 11061_1 CR5-6) TaxID=745531 RepID=A0A0C3NA64_PHLG1|nr:hypothetical protein PHLGIDRAFT_507322 [Phlebiopsis gigantea 11061_1 CR5-6]